MKTQLKGSYWILAAIGLTLVSGIATLLYAASADVVIFASIYSVANIVLMVMCYIGYKRKDRRWAIFAIAYGLFIMGFGVFATALDLMNEVSIASGLVLFGGGIRGIAR